MKQSRNLLIFIPFILLLSCDYSDKDFSFTQDETTFLNSFKPGDSLYFQNKEGEIDTIVISKLDSARYTEKPNSTRSKDWNEFKSISVVAKILPRDTIFESAILEEDTTRVFTSYFKEIITLTKKVHEEDTEFAYNLKNIIGFKSYMPLIQTDTLQLNNFSITNYFSNSFRRPDMPNDLLFFTIKDGLVGYEYGGRTWVRMDLKN